MGTGKVAGARMGIALHAAAFTAFAALTGLWLWPLVGRWGTAIPGSGPGDNVVFLWNVWWVRYAVLHGLSPLHTPMLLYPFGADLTMHTLTLLPALAVAFIPNPVAAQNTLIAAHLFLNFVVTYALAFAVTRSYGASVVAALAFGWSPFVSAHLAGHFNLIAAWVLPLAAWMALRLADRPSSARSAALGGVLGATAYVDYYYFLYAVLLAAILLLTPALRLRRRASGRGLCSSRIIVALAAAAALAALTAIAIAISGGGTLDIGFATVSMRSAWNPAAIAWLSGVGALVLWIAAPARMSIDRPALARRSRSAIAAVLVMIVVLSPLLVAALRLALAGGYVSQRYLWRSAPAGVDLLTLALGNPASAIYAQLPTHAYVRAGVDLVEAVAWLSPGLIVLAAYGLHARFARAWMVALAVFGLWALGPSLHAAGHASPFWLPAVLIRWLPIVSNARVPARAIVVVYLAFAMLAAFGVERLLRTRRTTLAVTMAVLLALDLAPHRAPLTTLPHPAALDAMAVSSKPGAVLNVPFGLRDGFGETGRLDPLAMWLQTIHERPMAGGFVARLPPLITSRYRGVPVVNSIFRLSSGEALSPADVAADRKHARELERLGFEFVLVDTRLANAAAQAYVRTIPLSRLESGDGFELYGPPATAGR